MSKPHTLLVEQRQALWDYLDALLQEIPEEPEAPAVEVPTPEPLPVVETPQPVPRVVLDAEPAVEPEPLPEITEAGSTPALPLWAESEFQALLFKVDGLTLAVPLVKLHSVVPWSDKVAPLPNQPDWCRGLMRYRERNVQVVDTGRLVIPPDRRAKLEPQPPAHILIVGDGGWGLVCSELGDVVRLEPGEVKWRTARGQRPWLAGTVLGHLCALMDTEAFAQMLAAARHDRRGRSDRL